MSEQVATPTVAMLSQAFVAFVVEADNEFERRAPHRTTRHGGTPGAPWLVSMAMWAHCLRHVPDEGIRARDLVLAGDLAAATMRQVVKRLANWWGYLRVARADSAGEAWVEFTDDGRVARRHWDEVPGVVQQRWRERFGEQQIAALTAALTATAQTFRPTSPRFLPLGAVRPRPALEESDPFAATLPSLLSQVLHPLAVDFDDHCELNAGAYTGRPGHRLPIAANLLRLCGDDGERAADLPAASGVDRMAVRNWLGALQKAGYVKVGADEGVARRNLVTPTRSGAHAREAYLGWALRLDRAAPLAQIRHALTPVTRDLDRLLECTAAPDGGWRNDLPQRTALPHYPVISPRGGFPDGS